VLSIASLRTDPDPILRCGSVPVTAPSVDLADLGQEMLEVMRDLDGVGLAGVQIGLLMRLFVLEAQGRVDIIVNPEILERHEPYHPIEGCLSVPGALYTPRRHGRVRVRWQSVTGEHYEEVLNGLLAEIFEHEVDHLDGTLLYELPQDSVVE
jgi:peptide deformylase